MWKSWKLWLVMAGVGAVVGAIGGVLAYGLTVNPKFVKSPLLNGPAPNFTITRLGGGETLTLSELKGTPVLLNFWASWCLACRDEAHVLQAAHKLYEEGQGRLRVLGIAIQDTPEKSMAFARAFGKTYFLALDNVAGDISLSYGLYGVPETFFIDAQGIIRFKHVGAVTPQLVRNNLATLLAPNDEGKQ
ncbi:MAG: redoxin domain-containing protein [SAR324 cluster bacterium]|nr:redoxin domain-containing protein [SAR324 cluster bacterium]